MNDESQQAGHIPVLAAEVMRLAEPRAGETWIDATTGTGGHASLLADRIGPTGRLVCIDQDEAMLRIARARLGDKARFFHASFDQLPVVLKAANVEAVDGVIADLGICSAQLDDPKRGFSFQSSGPLDMRMSLDLPTTASDLVNRLEERELADLFRQFGEERYSRWIARRIVAFRKQGQIRTTTELADIIRRCVPKTRPRQTIDPATRVFQALRIAVNDELGALDRLLQILPSCIRGGGRAAIISFHSLEDRRVKRAFADAAVWEAVTKKPVVPAPNEVAANPRARSAKLRVARRR